MKVIGPENIKESEVPVEVKKTDPSDPFIKKVHFWGNRISIPVFILCEFIIGASIFIILFQYGFQIFFNHSGIYASRAKNIIIFVNDHWKGFLFIPPLVFF